jgi:hypothetical protein
MTTGSNIARSTNNSNEYLIRVSQSVRRSRLEVTIESKTTTLINDSNQDLIQVFRSFRNKDVKLAI